jgi:hypothetical protein
VSLTDAPASYEHVYITVEKVRVHTSAGAGEGDAGWQDLTLAQPKRVDLLNLTNGVLEELGSMPLPAGTYTQLRLVLADNAGSNPPANAVQPNNGALTALKTPSGQQSGIKLQTHFTVEANKVVDLVLDFDACKSVVQAGRSGQDLLQPVISVTDTYTTEILGYVARSLDLAHTSVSAQQDGNVVRSTTPDASGKFVLAYLPNGTYTLVITSDDHATGVVDSVPVSTTTGITTVNGTATAIVLPASNMKAVSGTVTESTTANGTTTTVPVGDATVTALQTVGGDRIQVASTPVDFDLGDYTLTLPVAAPVRAPYVASGNLQFKAQDTAAGNYRLEASAPGRATLAKSIDLGATGAATANFRY